MISSIRSKRNSPPILSLFHPRDAIKDTDVVAFNQALAQSKIKILARKTKYVRIHLDSVHQAKTFTLLIALLTMKSIFHPTNFVKLFSAD